MVTASKLGLIAPDGPRQPRALARDTRSAGSGSARRWPADSQQTSLGTYLLVLAAIVAVDGRRSGKALSKLNQVYGRGHWRGSVRAGAHALAPQHARRRGLVGPPRQILDVVMVATRGPSRRPRPPPSGSPSSPARRSRARRPSPRAPRSAPPPPAPGPPGGSASPARVWISVEAGDPPYGLTLDGRSAAPGPSRPTPPGPGRARRAACPRRAGAWRGVRSKPRMIRRNARPPSPRFEDVDLRVELGLARGAHVLDALHPHQRAEGGLCQRAPRVEGAILASRSFWTVAKGCSRNAEIAELSLSSFRDIVAAGKDAFAYTSPFRGTQPESFQQHDGAQLSFGDIRNHSSRLWCLRCSSETCRSGSPCAVSQTTAVAEPDAVRLGSRGAPADFGAVYSANAAVVTCSREVPLGIDQVGFPRNSGHPGYAAIGGLA